MRASRFANQAMFNNDPHPLVIVKPGALGDTLLLAPALLALSEGFPHRRVIVVGTSPQVELLSLLGFASQTRSLEHLNLFHPSDRERNLLTGTDMLVFLALDRAARDRLQRIAGARVMALPSRPADPRIHVAVHLHRCVGQMVAGLPPLRRAVWEGDIGRPANVPRPYGLLFPGAGSPLKRAPLAYFKRHAHRMASRGIQPIFVIGPVEFDNGLAQALPTIGSCLHAPPLSELAALCRHAETVVANDSGPAHLAGLFGTPTTVYFGPTDPDQWRPWGARVRVRRFAVRAPMV